MEREMTSNKKNKSISNEMKKASENKDTSKAPQDGDKNESGLVYSSLYNGYVPGLYAQGR
jgi:hypothetical protein